MLYGSLILRCNERRAEMFLRLKIIAKFCVCVCVCV